VGKFCLDGGRVKKTSSVWPQTVVVRISSTIAVITTMLDSIESSIFRATEEVSRGAQEIARARDYQDKSRRKKFYLAMIFFIIMFIVLLITYTS